MSDKQNCESQTSRNAGGASNCDRTDCSTTKWRVEQFTNGGWVLVYLAATQDSAVDAMNRFTNFHRRVVKRVTTNEVVARMNAADPLAGSLKWVT